MQSVRVADNVLVNVGAGLQGIGMLPPADPFHFQVHKEAFHDGVIPPQNQRVKK